MKEAIASIFFDIFHLLKTRCSKHNIAPLFTFACWQCPSHENREHFTLNKLINPCLYVFESFLKRLAARIRLLFLNNILLYHIL
jgi:hypothetical protein